MDGKTLNLLASSGGIDQLRACGFTKIKDQLKLRNLAAEPPQDKGGILMYGSSSSNQHSNIGKSGKLSMAQIKQLSPVDKLLYLSKLVSYTKYMVIYFLITTGEEK